MIAMSDEKFPSGPWVGFYTYNIAPGKHRMDLMLTFSAGRVAGEGNDDVGAFVIAGGYDATTSECYWTKTYVGGHDVFYKGFREGKGIWGLWEIPDSVRGGFQIWPAGEGAGEHETLREDIAAPLEAVASGAAVP
jgi:hypothetical protein